MDIPIPIPVTLILLVVVWTVLAVVRMVGRPAMKRREAAEHQAQQQVWPPRSGAAPGQHQG